MTVGQLKERVQKLGLYGILANWSKYSEEPWLPDYLAEEEKERQARGLERRMRQAHLGEFKSMVDFDWKWPKKIDRLHISETLSLSFFKDSANVIVVGPNGVGKSMIIKNIVHRAILAGNTGIFTTASAMLNDLASKDSSNARKRCLFKYTKTQILAIDEIGYLSYDNRYADLLFEVISHRYEQRPTLITTNKPFREWNEVFPSATCVVSLVDRLVHHSEIITIDAKSYRLKESKESATKKKTSRKAKKKQ